MTNHVGKVQRLFGTVELYESVATWNSHFRKSWFFSKSPKNGKFVSKRRLSHINKFVHMREDEAQA